MLTKPHTILTIWKKIALTERGAETSSYERISTLKSKQEIKEAWGRRYKFEFIGQVVLNFEEYRTLRGQRRDASRQSPLFRDPISEFSGICISRGYSCRNTTTTITEYGQRRLRELKMRRCERLGLL